jgi:hypothetical protein
MSEVLGIVIRALGYCIRGYYYQGFGVLALGVLDIIIRSSGHYYQGFRVILSGVLGIIIRGSGYKYQGFLVLLSGVPFYQKLLLSGFESASNQSLIRI